MQADRREERTGCVCAFVYLCVVCVCVGGVLNETIILENTFKIHSPTPHCAKTKQKQFILYCFDSNTINLKELLKLQTCNACVFYYSFKNYTILKKNVHNFMLPDIFSSPPLH